MVLRGIILVPARVTMSSCHHMDAAPPVGFGMPGIQEIIIIILALGMLSIPVLVIVVVLVVCLRKKPADPPPLAQQHDDHRSE